MNIEVKRMMDEEYRNLDTSHYIPTILFVKLSDPSEEAFWQNEKGDWIDLKVAQDYDIKKGDFTLLDLGVAMKLPDGFEAIIAPRSSTFKKYGLLQTNGIGIIDNTYCGNNDIWKMPVLATRNTLIPKGTPIAQFKIQLSQKATIWQKLRWLFSPKIELVKVDELHNEDRGGLGTGSDKYRTK